MSDGKTHFADDATLDYIRDLEKHLAKAKDQRQNEIKKLGILHSIIAEQRAEIERLKEFEWKYKDLCK
jgi:hypothetical protein